MRETAEIIRRAIESSLGGPSLSRVFVEPTVDSDGKDALGITIVLGDGELSGPHALGMLVHLQEALTAAGDERFPIVEVTTENELAFDGGPEP